MILDLPDLVGIRQVDISFSHFICICFSLDFPFSFQIYYFCLNVPEASDLKSTELQRLYTHKRHPSFLGFFTLLWVTPLMR